MAERLYRQIGERLAARIRSGEYRPGERLPSVRRLSNQFGVSTSTAVKAYQWLEDLGLSEPRPQSGHFVRSSGPVSLPLPAMTMPAPSPTRVSLGELAMQVLRANEVAHSVPLGSAMPYTGFPALRRLRRLAVESARSERSQMLDFIPPPGLEALRRAIVRRAADAGIQADVDEVVVTTGCQEALNLSLQVVARPGDTIAIESPAFYGTLQAIETLGMRALEIPTHPETGISLEALELALDQWPIAACVLVPGFSNPLGYCMSDAAKTRLMELAARHGLRVVESDVFADLTYDSQRPWALKAFDTQGDGLVCGSFSKTLAPGLRVGWVLAGSARNRIEQLKFVSSGASNTLAQLVLARFLGAGAYDRHLRAARVFYRAQRDRFADLVAEHFPPQIRMTRPGGGYLTWVELPERVDALDLCRLALQRGISIAPGPLFSPKAKYRNFVRLNYACPLDGRIRAGVRTLGDLVRQLDR